MLIELHLFEQLIMTCFQFFHNIDESEVWLKDDLSRIEAMFDVENIGGDYDNAKALLREIEVWRGNHENKINSIH